MHGWRMEAAGRLEIGDGLERTRDLGEWRTRERGAEKEIRVTDLGVYIYTP